ncbi:MAG: RNA polymerase sigma factor [Lachnospiraceae bacterium]|nr:RNA polymerase sigma factor [Lachnospiraceae bacterium]
MAVNIEEEYDKIYRYCYFRLHQRELAEDITQETFLRYFASYHHMDSLSMLKCLYTIARNLCIDEYRRAGKREAEDPGGQLPAASAEEQVLTSIAVRAALSRMEAEEQELLLLRYVNEVPLAVIGQLYGISRFAAYRKLLAVKKKFGEELRKEGEF